MKHKLLPAGYRLAKSKGLLRVPIIQVHKLHCEFAHAWLYDHGLCKKNFRSSRGDQVSANFVQHRNQGRVSPNLKLFVIKNSQRRKLIVELGESQL